MAGRAIIALAVAVYLAVAVGCAVRSTQETSTVSDGGSSYVRGPAATRQLTGLPYRGAAIQIQRLDWINDYKKCMDEIAAEGLDTVLLVVDSRQENGSSNGIYLDMRLTPTSEQLGDLIDHAKGLKLRVVLMPIVLLDSPRGNEWRGTIKPAVWEDWFNSYRGMITHFAYIAQNHGVDVLVVGSELVSTQNKIEEWGKTIAGVRSIFHGQLTYSANWDDYWNVPFWDQLDMVGMNTYWKLAEKPTSDKPLASIEEIEQHWQQIQNGHDGIPSLMAFQKKVGKPILLLEVGWCSLRNAAYEPWDYTKETEPVDLELQRRLYEAFFRSWHGNPAMAGFMIWAWGPGDGGPEDRGYTPKNKPAEKVLRSWVAKPWTQR